MCLGGEPGDAERQRQQQAEPRLPGQSRSQRLGHRRWRRAQAGWRHHDGEHQRVEQRHQRAEVSAA